MNITSLYKLVIEDRLQNVFNKIINKLFNSLNGDQQRKINPSLSLQADTNSMFSAIVMI